MKLVSTIFRNPCCSKTYEGVPKTLVTCTRRSRANWHRSNGPPTNWSLMSSLAKKGSRAWMAEKWLPE